MCDESLDHRRPGLAGKALTEVVSQHHTVRVFDLESAEAPRQELDFDGEVIFGSVTDYEAVRSAVEGQDAVVHSAVASTVLRGLYKPDDPVPTDVNVRGTYHVWKRRVWQGESSKLQLPRRTWIIRRGPMWTGTHPMPALAVSMT